MAVLEGHALVLLAYGAAGFYLDGPFPPTPAEITMPLDQGPCTSCSWWTWFAGLFYLPACSSTTPWRRTVASRGALQIMERKLYRGIMAPGAILTLVFGTGCGSATASPVPGSTPSSGIVVLLIAYHLYCGRLLCDFARRPKHEVAPLVPLVQRGAGGFSRGRGRSGRSEAVLAAFRVG